MVPGHIGLLQATEVLKLILGIGTPLIGQFYVYNALTLVSKTIEMGKNSECPLCGTNPRIADLRREGTFGSEAGKGCGY